MNFVTSMAEESPPILGFAVIYLKISFGNEKKAYNWVLTQILQKYLTKHFIDLLYKSCPVSEIGTCFQAGLIGPLNLDT